MRISWASVVLGAGCVTGAPVAHMHGVTDHAIRPKVFIISMFAPEAEVWWGIPQFNLLEHNITLPGLSPLFPAAHCTKSGHVCQVVTGESEINAASTIASLVASPRFELAHTYFLIAGIAGANPARATLGGVAFARYAVQVALQYEIDPREQGMMNFSTGYIPFGTSSPNSFPQQFYGTEVFEVNDALRTKAIAFARKATLSDNPTAAAYRAKYAAPSNSSGPSYAAALAPPAVVACDVATSDVFYSGAILGNAFDTFTRVVTNGTGAYCATAQEDNASLNALMRGARAGLLDFGRVVVMRTLSNFDRPYAGEAPLFHLRVAESGGFPIAISNIYNAGIEVVQGILEGWNAEYERGIEPTNYIGDVFGTLGGTPDFGPGKVVSVNRRRL